MFLSDLYTKFLCFLGRHKRVTMAWGVCGGRITHIETICSHCFRYIKRRKGSAYSINHAYPWEDNEEKIYAGAIIKILNLADGIKRGE